MVRRLGAEFRRRRMANHLAPLRVYWLALKHGLVDADQGLHVTLSGELIVEWYKLLRLPPFEAAYPTRAAGSACPLCPPSGSGGGADVVTERSFPEGRKVSCVQCRTAWLELESATRMGRGTDVPADALMSTPARASRRG